jgi:hypothetical protein
MPALNFKKEFVEKIRSGEKRQTIRALRKDGRDPKKGDILYLYTGMRTKSCQRIDLDFEYEGVVIDSLYPIMGAIRCKSSEPILICGIGNIYVGKPFVDHLKASESHAIAIADGFNNIDDFNNFFRKNYGLPFEGRLIKW